MELSKLLQGKIIFLDTAPLIYFIEKNVSYIDVVKPVIALIDSRQARANDLNDYLAGGQGNQGDRP